MTSFTFIKSFSASLLLCIAALSLSPFAQAQDLPPNAANIRFVEVASGLRLPLSLTNAGDGSGRLFVTSKHGDIWVIHDGMVNLFMNVSPLLAREAFTSAGERGLYTIAFSPDYRDSGVFYITYTATDGANVLARYHVSTLSPDIADPSSAEILLRLEHPGPFHNGGQLAFGPDGYLYAGFGDGSSEHNQNDNSQNRAELLGSVLRLDVSGAEGYAIPPDNPFVGNSTGWREEIWAYGLRNPWRFSFDRLTHDLYIADVGERDIEEINFQPADSAGGQNYGWNAYEGHRRTSLSDAPPDAVMPILEYTHLEGGCAIIGGYVYRGALVPELQGRYIYGDYCTGKIWAAQRDDVGEWHSALLIDTDYVISSFGEDEAGELYVVNFLGSILRFEPAAS